MTIGGMSIIDAFKAGGWPMYGTLILSIVAVAVTLEKILVVFMQKLKINPEKFADLFNATMKKHEGDKGKTILELTPILEKRGGIAASLLQVVFTKFKDGVSKRMGPVEIRSWMKEAMEEQANVELPMLETRLIALAVIANVATLVGLFGTVLGMIESFTAMSNSPGGVKADEMAGGIAIALICTAGGLVVAVPSMIVYNMIKGYLGGFVSDVEALLIRVIDELAE